MPGRCQEEKLRLIEPVDSSCRMKQSSQLFWAHEIVHSAARHGAKMMERNILDGSGRSWNWSSHAKPQV